MCIRKKCRQNKIVMRKENSILGICTWISLLTRAFMDINDAVSNAPAQMEQRPSAAHMEL